MSDAKMILYDAADGYREGLVTRVERMPNVDGRWIIYYKPIGFSGLFSEKEIPNIPDGGFKKRERPDGNITFVLLLNESGEAPFLKDLGIHMNDLITAMANEKRVKSILKGSSQSDKEEETQDKLIELKRLGMFKKELNKGDLQNDKRQTNGG
jgi:hypothetical protein